MIRRPYLGGDPADVANAAPEGDGIGRIQFGNPPPHYL
jgi:hypothetical protein